MVPTPWISVMVDRWRPGLVELGLVGYELPIQAAQVGDEFGGQLAAACVGRGERACRAQQRRGLVGRQVERGAAGDQIPQKDVQTVQDPDAFACQVVATLGEQRSCVV